MLFDRSGVPAHAPAHDAQALTESARARRVGGRRPVEIERPLLASDWQKGLTDDCVGQVRRGQRFSWFSGPGS